GTSWTNVTPPALGPWAKVSIIEASHFDPNTAYAAINTLRLDDLRPHIFRTRDGGQRWVEITRGLSEGGVINVVREDSQRRGLLFAGSEQAVFVSFDDGESWQPMRFNMPATSVRDLTIKDGDLIAGTHGRGFWILDDITPLRQVTPDIARAAAYLFRPLPAFRFRWNKNTDTPLPPDEPAAPNPPDGITLSYLLGAPAKEVSIEVVDNVSGEVIRRYSNTDPPESPVDGRNIPDYWIRPAQKLLATAGLHRFVWDVRYAPPAVDGRSYDIAAVEGGTPKSPQGMFVLPGTYQVRLTVDGRSFRQPIVVRMDPRVKTSLPDLTLQFKLSRAVDDALRRLAAARADVELRASKTAGPESETLRTRAAALQAAYAALPALFDALQEADLRPNPAVEAAVTEALARVEKALAPSLPGSHRP
ncbi:MAG TPA: hypothetical protein VMS54_01070, partial [Vicinamibacterales bacterium]|nr:hypothetical protein [Vicinamibacterales bacterium]